MISRAILIDDEQMGVDTLALLLKLYASDVVKVVASTTQPKAAIELIENFRPELVFLDINMPGLTGFELLDKLEYKSFDLVFTTAHQEYALKALKNGAADYLLKPIDKVELMETLQRIAHRKNTATTFQNSLPLLDSFSDTHTKTRVLINSKASYEYLEANTLLYLESESNYTRAHLSSGESLLSPRTLKEFEADLCGENQFMRIHQSYIVNLHKVARYLKSSEELVMCNERKLPVSRNKKESFLTWLNQY